MVNSSSHRCLCNLELLDLSSKLDVNELFWNWVSNATNSFFHVGFPYHQMKAPLAPVDVVSAGGNLLN